MDPIDDYLDRQQLRGIRPNTIRRWRGTLRALERFLGHDALEATPEELDAWQRRALARCSQGSRRGYTDDVCAFYRWAYDNDLVSRDPSRRLVRPRHPHYQPRPASLDDVRAAIAAAPQPIRIWLVLQAFEGLRACEVAALLRTDVLDTNDPPLLRVREGKGGHPRLVPLSQLALDELTAYGLGRVGPLWRTTTGRPWHPHNVSTAINRYLRSIGLTITSHQFRHFFGTTSYRLCRDFLTVAELMGHRDTRTTRGYVEYSPDSGARVVNELAAAHGPVANAEPRTQPPAADSVTVRPANVVNLTSRRYLDASPNRLARVFIAMNECRDRHGLDEQAHGETLKRALHDVGLWRDPKEPDFWDDLPESTDLEHADKIARAVNLYAKYAPAAT